MCVFVSLPDFEENENSLLTRARREEVSNTSRIEHYLKPTIDVALLLKLHLQTWHLEGKMANHYNVQA